MRIEVEREDDGRWIAEVADLPGVIAYGASEAEARSKAAALARAVIEDRVANDDPLGPSWPGEDPATQPR
jgi:predicted RNase H-like HicB family nuclease